MNNSEKNLRTQWCNFLSTVLHPPVIIFLSCTVGLLYANYFIKDNKTITILLSVLMIFSSGLVGTFIRKRWEELAEKPHLLAKGKMAVRNLRLLSNNIGYYELRLRKYIDRVDNNELSKERALEYFEEIIDWCLSLREICWTSIENWEDIIPDVKDLTSKIGKLFDLGIREEELKNQITSVSKRLEEAEKAQDETKGEKDQLLKQLSEKEEASRLVGKQVQELRQSIRSSVGGLALGTSGYSGYNALTKYGNIAYCEYCKKEFYYPLGPTAAPICDECGRLGKVGKALGGGS